MIRRLILGAGIILLLGSAWSFMPRGWVDERDFRPELERGIALFFVGGLLLMVGLRDRDMARAKIAPTEHQNAPSWREAVRRFGILRFMFGGVMLLFVAEVSGGLTGWVGEVSAHVQMVAFCAGIALVVLAFPRGTTAENATISWPEIILITIIFIFGLTLRLWRLDETVRILVDEVNFLHGVMTLWNRPVTPIMTPMAGVAPFSFLHPYAEAVTSALLGRDLGGFRAASAVFGAAQVVALWWLVRQVNGRWAAVMAAVLLAALPPHVHFSRIGINNISDPLFGLLTLGFLVRAFRTGAPRDFAAAGAMLGLTQYFHNAGMLFWMGLVGVWVLLMWFRHVPMRFIGVTAVTAAVAAFPVYYGYLANSEPLFGRLSEGTVGTPTLTPWRMAVPFLHYVYLPDETLFYSGDTGLVLPLLIPFLLLGCWVAARRGLLLPLLCLIFTAAGSMLLRDSATSTRFIVALPALAWLLAIGADTLVRIVFFLPHPFRTFRPQDETFSLPSPYGEGQNTNVVFGFGRVGVRLIGVTTLFIAFATIYQVEYYFNTHIEAFTEAHHKNRLFGDFEDVAFRAAALEPGTTHVHMVSSSRLMDINAPGSLLSYLEDGFDMAAEVNPSMDYFVAMRRDYDQAIFVLPDDETTLDTMRQAFDDLPPPQKSPHPNVHADQYDLYFLPALMTKPQVEIRDRDARFNAELWLMLLGLAVVGVVWWRFRRPIVDSHVLTTTFTQVREVYKEALANRHDLLPYRIGVLRRRFLILCGVLLLIGLTIINVTPSARVSWNVQMALWVAGVGFLTLSPFVSRPPRIGNTRLSRYASHSLSRVNSTSLVQEQDVHVSGLKSTSLMPFSFRRAAQIPLILLLAFAVRIIALETTIPRHIDELLSVEAIVNLWDDLYRRIFVPNTNVAAFPPVYNVMQTWTADIFGGTLTALRIVSAVFGTLTVAGTYALAKTFFDRRIALLAALVLAVLPAHLHFSRIGLNNVVDPFFGVMALTFLLRGLRRDRLDHIALAGVMLGLTQYWYEGGRLLFPPLLLTTALLSRRMSWRGWLTLIGTFVVVAAPVYVTLWSADLSTLPRLEDTRHGSAYWSGLLRENPLDIVTTLVSDHLLPPIEMLLYAPDQSWFYAARLMTLPLLPFFVVGLLVLVSNIPLAMRERGTEGVRATWRWLLLLWLLAVIVGNALLVDKQEAPRYVVVLPALAIVVAVGISYVATILERILIFLRQSKQFAERSKRPAVGGSIFAIALLLIAAHIGWYFTAYADDFLRRFPDVAVMDDVRLRAADLPDNTHIHIISDIVIFDTDSYHALRFSGRHDDGVFITTERPGEIGADYVERLLPGRTHAIFVAPDDAATLALLRDDARLDGPFPSAINRPPDGRYVMFLTR